MRAEMGVCAFSRIHHHHPHHLTGFQNLETEFQFPKRCKASGIHNTKSLSILQFHRPPFLRGSHTEPKTNKLRKRISEASFFARLSWLSCCSLLLLPSYYLLIEASEIQGGIRVNHGWTSQHLFEFRTPQSD